MGFNKNSLENNTGNSTVSMGLAIRSQFPIFPASAGHLAYLDTAASAQKPKVVIDRLSQYLSHEHANIHRGAYALSAKATELYDEARCTVAKFIGAKDSRSVIFTKGTTESVNLVAHAFENFLNEGDVILVTLLEHHSNFVPWQLLAARKKVKLEFVNVTEVGQLDLEDLGRKLKALKPKLLAVTQISNALGTIVPIAEVIEEAHKVGCKVLVDAAQSVPHQKLDVTSLDADFVVFSGHKLYGPTGIGVLYGKFDLLARMQPFQGGGDMIRTVSVDGSTWAEPPERFEAGTPPIAEAIALGTAVEFVESLGLSAIKAHEEALTHLAYETLKAEDSVELYGPITKGLPQASIVSFNVKGVHAHDLSTIADSQQVQLRAGHHCAMPLLTRLKIYSSARISFGAYSCKEDLPPLIEAIRLAKRMFT